MEVRSRRPTQQSYASGIGRKAAPHHHRRQRAASRPPTTRVLAGRPGPAPLWLFTRATSLTTPGAAIAATCGPAVEPRTEIRPAGSAPSCRTYPELGRLWAGATDVGQPRGRPSPRGGVCQDHAHIFIAAARRSSAFRPAMYRLSVDGRHGRPGRQPCLGGGACQSDRLGRVRYLNRISPDEPLCPRGHRVRLSGRHARFGHVALVHGDKSWLSASGWNNKQITITGCGT